MENGVSIGDGAYLDQLISAQIQTSDSIKDLLEQVNRDFDALMKNMEEQKNCLEKKMQEAERRYQQAEAAHSRCLASQRYDEEDKCYRPSCDAEAANAERYRKEYEDLNRRYQQAEQILNDCNNKLNEFRSSAADVKNMLDERTGSASDKMNMIKDKLSEYDSSSVSLGSLLHSNNNSNKQEASAKVQNASGQDSNKTEEERQAKIKAVNEARQNLENQMKRQDLMQKLKNATDDLKKKDAENIPRCPQCHRPKYLCTCPKETGARSIGTGAQYINILNRGRSR